MICEFLDYYSSRFDLNRCIFSASVIRHRWSGATARLQPSNISIARLKSQRAKVFYHFFHINSPACAVVRPIGWLFLKFSMHFDGKTEESERATVACENKMHSRNYIVRQKRNVSGNFLKIEIVCVDQRIYMFGSSTYHSTTKWIFIWAMESQQQFRTYIIYATSLLLFAYRFDENQYFNFFSPRLFVFISLILSVHMAFDSINGLFCQNRRKNRNAKILHRCHILILFYHFVLAN